MGGISFLNTGLLVFAAATILPLLIWLLAKKKPKRIVFSSLRFIKQSQEQEKKRTRLKNIILLIIRMLIILLVTLAVARPLFRSRHLKPSAKHPPTALAILLDTSYSMDYVYEAQSNLDRAKQAVRQINARCTPQDRLILITSDQDWNRLHSQIYAGSLPEDLIEGIRISYTPLSVAAMLELGETKLREAQLANREIYYITDIQQQEYPASAELPLSIIPIGTGQGYDNLSCSGARVLPQLVEKTRRQSIEFKLNNHGDQDRNDVLVKVVLGEVKVAEKFVNVPARQSINQSIVIDLPQDGWQSGYVEVMDDRLSSDNRSYFAFPFQLTPRIALISSLNQAPEYLSTLLSVYAGNQGRIDLLHPDRVNLSSLDDYQTFVFYQTGNLSPRLREVITALPKRNQGALFCLDKNLPLDAKSFIGSLFGADLGSWKTQPTSLSYINQHHYITSLLAGKNIQNNRLTDFWRASSAGGVVLLGSGRDALALARDNLVLWAFDIGSRGSSFFLDASFPVFAYRSLEYISTAISGGEGYTLGEIVTANRITLPGGDDLELANRSYQLSSPGLYTLHTAGKSETVIAVNAPLQESEFTAMDFSGLKYVRLLDENWQDSLFHTRLGHDLWKYLLAAALLLFLIEIILVKLEEARPLPISQLKAGSST